MEYSCGGGAGTGVTGAAHGRGASKRRMHEVELKLVVDRDAAEKVWDRARNAGILLGEPVEQPVVSTYLDTPGNRLHAAGISIRLRQAGDEWVQTIKASREIAGGLSRSLEIETSACDGRFDLERVDDPLIREKIVSLAGDTPLQPVFRTEMIRKAAPVRAGEDGEAILSTDHGSIHAGERTEGFDETEIELVEGDAASLFMIAGELFPPGSFTLSSRSKAERGFLLAETGSMAGPARIRKSGHVDLQAGMPASDAARLILRDCAAQIGGNLEAVRCSDAPEAIHQLRVGLRRLRTALAVFRPVTGSAEAARLVLEARWLANEAGRLRDLDVVSMELAGREAEAHPGEAGLAVLAGVLADARSAMQAHVRELARGRRARAFVFDLVRFVESGNWTHPSGGREAGSVPKAKELGSAALARRWKKVRRKARGIAHQTAAQRHELRKELKKLRYAAEFFASLYSGKESRAFLQRLRRLQLVFGDLNDAAMAQDLFSGMDDRFRVEPRLERSVGWVLGAAHARAATSWEHAQSDWKRLKKTRAFWT